MRRAIDPDYSHVYTVVKQWRDRSFSRGASLFQPDVTLWTPDVVGDVYTRFVEGADASDRTFMDKLEDQMSGASQLTCMLMAELMFVHLLPLTNVKGETKITLVETIGSWATSPIVVPDDLRCAASPGIFNGGIGFNTGRPNHLRFLIRLARRWVRFPEEERDTLLDDPWAFKSFLYDLPIDGAVSQRNAILLLLFPETFEDISSRVHKRRIVEAYPEYAGESSDIDRQMLAIREAKTKEFGQDFSWYAPQVRSTWDNKQMKVPQHTRSPSDALQEFLPGEDDRKAFIDAVADSIELANSIDPLSWSLTWRRNGLHLNIGPNRVLSAHREGAGMAVIAERYEEFRDRLQADGIKVPAKPYVWPGDTYFIDVDADRFGKLFIDERDNLIAGVEGTATRQTPYWKSHSVAALDAIREASGRDLPNIPERESRSSDQQAWIIRVKIDGKSDATTSLEQGDSRIFWKIDVPAGSTLAVIKENIRKSRPEITNHSLGNQAGNIHRFITRISEGDVVLMPDGSQLYVGTVMGDASYDPEQECWVRPVEWTEDSIDRADVSPALYSRLRSLLTVTEITELLPELVDFLGAGEEDQVDPTPLATRLEVNLAAIDDDTAAELMLDREWLEEIVELLRRKRQLIFYGPPGTGKTYLAEKLASYLTAEAGNYQLVQFHPSYSYEDFVEGFRPQVDENGALSYVLTPGPLKQLADAARKSPTEPFLLIIDEINRGNLAKIFGELYYLLEYRDQSLILQYGGGSEDEFSLPRNLFVIGTMNTADRSIAMVDAAIRRRFNFVEFSPNRSPISDLLRSWLRHNDISEEPADVLVELNRRLDNDDYAIGPSYLMNDDVKSQMGLERIWKYSIMPLLIEHFYGQRGVAERFELASLQKQVRVRDQQVNSDPDQQLESGDG